MSYDSSSIETEIYSNRKNLRLLKFVFFIYKHAGIKLTSTQWVLATPTLIDTWTMNIINVWILLEPLTYDHDAWVCEDTSSGSFDYRAFPSHDLIPYTNLEPPSWLVCSIDRRPPQVDLSIYTAAFTCIHSSGILSDSTCTFTKITIKGTISLYRCFPNVN